LAKLLTWHLDTPLVPSERLVHQADYVAAHLLSDQPSRFWSDWHNALKLGFNVHTLQYPLWLEHIIDAQSLKLSQLPSVQ
jgi:hypothetical protein